MKRIRYIIFAFILSFAFILKINAFSVTGPTTVNSNSNFNVTVEASGLTGRFDVSTTGSISGGKSIWLEDNSMVLTFYAGSAGSGSIVVTAKDVDENGNEFTGKRILYVTVKDKSSNNASAGQGSSSGKSGNSKNNNSNSTKNNTKTPSVDVNKKYNSNNFLKSLSIDGYELDPLFDKNKLEYNVMLNVDTKLVKINAETEDSEASITGAGEVDVVDGINKIEIIVTAENGNERRYVINATVKELDPINVKVDGKKYTVVRKKGQVENIPVGFTETTIKIGDQDVCVYQSEIAKILLVALKDNEGNIKLFIYDKNKNSYTSFMEAKGGEVNLLILDKKKIKAPTDFVKTSFKINDLKIEGYKYKYDKNDNYYLVYAKNLETGDEGFYLYDKKNNIFSRYYKELSDIKDMHTKYVFYVAAALALIFVLIIIFKLFGKFKSNDKKIEKYQRKIDKLKGKIKNEDFNYDYSIDDVDDGPVIKRVEEDEYVMPKKSRKEKLKELEEAKKRLDKNKPKYRRLSLEDDDEL